MILANILKQICSIDVKHLLFLTRMFFIICVFLSAAVFFLCMKATRNCWKSWVEQKEAQRTGERMDNPPNEFL